MVKIEVGDNGENAHIEATGEDTEIGSDLAYGILLLAAGFEKNLEGEGVRFIYDLALTLLDPGTVQLMGEITNREDAGTLNVLSIFVPSRGRKDKNDNEGEREG